MNYRNLILIIIFFISIINLNGQGFLTTQGKSIVNDDGEKIILRGMGLGGWMLQEGYMLLTADFASSQSQIRQKIEDLAGIENTQIFYDEWLKNFV
ncbi:MAG TPA: glycosyl hydrolase family 5, partial [Bacteroidetes bacterium]|nr:glycosyl hydrolase family 5 [Bacteroidota bacterium]